MTGSGAEPELLAATVDADTGASLEDLGGSAFRKPCGVKEPHNPDVLQEFMRSTGARIGGGACGTRPSTTAYLRFLADHARSKGTVFREVPEEWLRRRGMLAVQTLVEDKDTYLTRPDGGVLGGVPAWCGAPTIPQVLIVLSDGRHMPARHGRSCLADQWPEAGRVHGGRSAVLRYGQVKAEDRLVRP
ncbi:MAG: ethanolamine ammonia-lyase light chain EutC [Bilophila wadsworthia]